MIIAISASFVTCCMLLTLLTFCVSALYMFSALYYCFLLVFLFCFFLLVIFLEALFEESSPRDRATDLCTEPEIMSPNSGRTFVLFIEKKNKKKRDGLKWEERRKKREILDYFGGLVLDCITTVSGVQSVIAECSLYICVHYILPERRQ